jgi:hypothetical protein
METFEQMSSDDLEILDNVSLFVMKPDELGAMFAIPVDERDEQGRPKRTKHSLFIRTEDGLMKVKRIFLEFGDDSDEE